MSERRDRRPQAGLFLGVAGASLAPIFARWSHAPSLVTATGRMGWSVILLLPLLLLKYRTELLATSRRDLIICAMNGICLGFHFAVWFEALRCTSIASAMVLINTEVIFTALGFALFFKGHISKAGAAAIAVAFGGSIVLALSDYASGVGVVKGDLLALLGAVLVAAYTLVGRKQRSRQSTTVYSFLTYFTCLLTIIVLSLATGTQLTGWGKRELLVGLGLAVFCTLLGHSMFSWSLKWLSPAYVSSLKLVEPILSALLGLLIFHEGIKPLQVIGGIIILAGVYAYTRTEQHAAEIILKESE